MSSTSTFSSILCIVLPTRPNSTTGHIFEIKRASEVPPEVDCLGLILTTLLIA